jgi:hypothetical protein
MGEESDQIKMIRELGRAAGTVAIWAAVACILIFSPVFHQGDYSRDPTAMLAAMFTLGGAVGATGIVWAAGREKKPGEEKKDGA